MADKKEVYVKIAMNESGEVEFQSNLDEGAIRAFVLTALLSMEADIRKRAQIDEEEHQTEEEVTVDDDVQ